METKLPGRPYPDDAPPIPYRNARLLPLRTFEDNGPPSGWIAASLGTDTEILIVPYDMAPTPFRVPHRPAHRIVEIAFPVPVNGDMICDLWEFFGENPTRWLGSWPALPPSTLSDGRDGQSDVRALLDTPFSRAFLAWRMSRGGT